MAFDSQSTVRSRELGDAVRLAMECANFNGKCIADLLGWSESKVSRILTGHVPPSEVELSALLALCGVTGEKYYSLLNLCRDQALLNWSTGSNAVASHHRQAMRITEFHSSLIPTLLQVSDYTWSLTTRMVNLASDGIDSWLSARQQGQTIFEHAETRPPSCTFIIHEQALQLPVGGREVMSRQLHHLLRMSVRRYVDIRVIPTAIGAHPGTSGPFSLLEFLQFRPVAYIEYETGGHFVEDESQIAKYQKVVAALLAVAIDCKTSAHVIERAAVAYAEGVH